MSAFFGKAGRRFAILLGGLLMAAQMPAHAAVEYIHTDSLGTPVAITDSDGNVIQTSEYEPYGKLLNRPLTDAPGYTGHETDATTGMVYAQQRYYDPQIGRFLSTDPVTVDLIIGTNFNRYWYGNNNPYRFTDPDGRCGTDEPSKTCLQAEGTPKAGAKDVKLSPATQAFANSNATRSNMAVNGGNKETVKAITPTSDGRKLTSLGNTTTGENSKGPTAGGDLPANAEAVIHGHETDSMVDQAPLGDSGVPVVNGLPNVTVSNDGKREGVHEIENGRVQFRMIRGSMSDSEQKAIQSNLNQAQTIFNPPPPPPPQP